MSYTKHGDVLTFKFHVPGFSQEQIDALVGEIICQAEANSDHPEATVIHQSDALDADDIDVDADGYDLSERDYDPDEDRTP